MAVAECTGVGLTSLSGESRLDGSGEASAHIFQLMLRNMVIYQGILSRYCIDDEPTLLFFKVSG